MFAVLCSAPRPPLGVALLGLTIVASSWMLYLLPYIMFCGMIALSVWPPSHPLPPDVAYYPIHGHPNQVHMVYARVGSQPFKEARSFELNAELRILVFLLAVPVTSVVENAFFRPARSIFLRTIECWFDMRYVHPAQMTGSWPDTWTPIFNALRSCEFVGDFIDGATGRNSGPSPAHTAETHTSGPFAGIDAFGGSHSMVQPTEQGAPFARQCKRASSSDPIAHSSLECSTNAPRPRKTFILPPQVSLQSPWKANGLGGFSPSSKNLSRIVGILFHHPPLRKPVIHCQINLMARAPSAGVLPHILERLWSRTEDNVAPAWESMSSLGTAIRNSLVPWHDGAQLLRSAWDHVSNHLVAVVPELGEHIAGGSLPLSMGSRFLPGTFGAPAIEQTQSEQQQRWGYAHPPLTFPPHPEPPVQAVPPDLVSVWQEQYFRPWSMETPVHHGFPYHDQHITTAPVYRQQEPIHQSFHGFPSGLDSMAFVQHGSHVYSDVPERPIADQELRASPVFGQRPSLAPVLESPFTPFSSLPVSPQEQFTFRLLDHVPLFQFSEDAPRLDHWPPSASLAHPETPVIPCASDGYATTAEFVLCKDEFSHSSSRSIPFDAPPETAWSNCHHQSPTFTSPVLQPHHIARPFWGLRVTRAFTFDVSRVIPYFDFSHHVPPPHSHGIELDVIPQATTAVPFPSDSQDVNNAWSPVSASCKYPLRYLSFDQGVQIQQALRDPTSQPQEVASNYPPKKPLAPAEQEGSTTGDIARPDAEPSTAGPKMDLDSNDSSSDSSDSSDSDSDSDSDMDSDSDSSLSDDDSDSDSDSSEDENDAVAAETDYKASSRAPYASSKAQGDVQGVTTNKNKDTSAPAAVKDDGGDSDSDSDGYFEHIPTPAPPGASNNDDSSSSDEDMSDHEEEDRLYWERFYTPRHRRQPDVSVSA